jgi:hypothetical protein
VEKDVFALLDLRPISPAHGKLEGAEDIQIAGPECDIVEVVEDCFGAVVLLVSPGEVKELQDEVFLVVWKGIHWVGPVFD